MAVFRVERNTGYTVMSNHHLRNKELSLKAKPTRIEYGDNWYLVGIRAEDLNGLRVRI